MKSFQELIQQSLKEIRQKSLIIVDYFHAYSYLSHKLDGLKSYAEAVYDNDNNDIINQKEVLKLFVDIAALSQHCAEELRLLTRSDGNEKEKTTKINEDTLKLLKNILQHIINNKEETKQLQRGRSRYQVFFDEQEINILMDLLQKYE